MPSDYETKEALWKRGARVADYYSIKALNWQGDGRVFWAKGTACLKALRPVNYAVFTGTTIFHPLRLQFNRMEQQ